MPAEPRYVLGQVRQSHRERPFELLRKGPADSTLGWGVRPRGFVLRRRYMSRGSLILVVDDVPDARHMYTMYLKHHGFRVVEASNGVEAADAALQHSDETQHVGIEIEDTLSPEDRGNGSKSSAGSSGRANTPAL